ncbi:MAG: bacillithiol biosynthesis cysteine-adding enzyme BshC [Candidatus Kapabacteria bacterium]|nr:bacillithiol biosynthesis cysteine-adding enzyme BshC [Candidatus Kapabacteria bacterium]
MTFNTIKYDNLPGFSKLFLDFINDHKFFDDRFPNNKKLYDDKSFLDKISQSNTKRDLIVETILNTMRDIDLNPTQIENLNLLKSSKTLTVVTGQQVGFLGGPLYTLIKGLSAVALSNKLKNYHKDFSFVPIFWIEDNDHDNLESSQITFFDKDYNPIIYNCDEHPDKSDRRTVSSRFFDSYIDDVINNICIKLSEINTNENFFNLLKQIYIPSKNWSYAFVELMNHLIGSTGILFISASKLQKTGIFVEFVQKELENLGRSDELIQFANSQIEKNGYHIQAKTNKINLFYHKDDYRYKIEPINKETENFRINNEIHNEKELLAKLSKDNAAFSPNVLLRPVFQDFVLPTIAYVAGPSEIGYCSQLKEVYEYFNVTMPAFIPRHSITFVDRKISRFLEKNQLNPEFFFSKKEILMNFIKEKFTDKNTELIFNQSIVEIRKIFENLKTYAKSIEPTLEATVDSAAHKTKEMIETIEKKIKSAELKKYDFLMKKYIETNLFLYPFETFQERIYSPINFILTIEKEDLIENILNMFQNDPVKHFIIYL